MGSSDVSPPSQPDPQQDPRSYAYGCCCLHAKEQTQIIIIDAYIKLVADYSYTEYTSFNSYAEWLPEREK